MTRRSPSAKHESCTSLVGNLSDGLDVSPRVEKEYCYEDQDDERNTLNSSENIFYRS